MPVVKIDYDHGIDIQQLFAQLLIEFDNGEQWWLTGEEQATLESLNRKHRTVSVIRELIEDRLDVSRKDDPNLPAMTPTELLIELNYQHPSNSRAKECASVLREIVGESKKIHGIYRWRIPFRKQPPVGTFLNEDHKIY